MESVREKWLQGIISEKEYTSIAISKTIDNLVQDDFQFLRILGQGGFGSVVEVKSPHTRQKLAAKIVLQEYVSLKEKENWPYLNHQNLLPLLESFHYPTAYTYTFIMPKLPIDLYRQLHSQVFRYDKEGFERTISWIQDTINAISYLHDKSLCHLDIKCDNVLISETDSAVLCDFGFLTFTKGPVEEYGSPKIYRPPEAKKEGSITTPVNGYKYDIWTTGLLALEVFSGLHIATSSRKWKEFAWENEIYNTIYDMIQIKQLKNHLVETFPLAYIPKNKVKMIQNFIMQCIPLNPKNRCEIKELLSCEIFGGHKTSCTNNSPNVWAKKATPRRIKFLVDLYSHQESVQYYIRQQNLQDTQDTAHTTVTTLITSTAHATAAAITTATKEATPPNNHVTEPSRRERLRNWAVEKRRSLRKLFTGCFPLRRPRSE